MRKRRGSGFFAGIFVGVLFSMTFFLVMYFLDIQILPASSLASDIRNRAEIVESYIDSYYWKDDVSDQTISEYAAKGMVAALGDKYSAYFTSEELKSSMEDVEGDYEGIGASVRYDEKTKNKTIQEVQKGRPAQKAGLKAGDILLSVNGEDVTKLSLNDTIQKIKGKEGKKSELVVLREENGEKTKKKITVTCEKIVNQTVTHRMLSGKRIISRLNTPETVTFMCWRHSLTVYRNMRRRIPKRSRNSISWGHRSGIKQNPRYTARLKKWQRIWLRCMRRGRRKRVISLDRIPYGRGNLKKCFRMRKRRIS